MKNWMFTYSCVYHSCDSAQPQTRREKWCSLYLADLSLCSATSEGILLLVDLEI